MYDASHLVVSLHGYECIVQVSVSSRAILTVPLPGVANYTIRFCQLKCPRLLNNHGQGESTPILNKTSPHQWLCLPYTVADSSSSVPHVYHQCLSSAIVSRSFIRFSILRGSFYQTSRNHCIVIDLAVKERRKDC